MRRSISSTVLLALALTACNSPRGELREWQPSDHQQPGSVDPAATGRASAPEEDASPAETEARAAAALFRTMCATCHGESGVGDGPSRPPVAPVVDLTSPALQEARTDGELAAVIRDGRGGFMPAFGAQLSPAGIDALVRHIRRLGGAASTGTAAPEAATDDAP